MQLFFDRQHRKEQWSLFKEIDYLDELLSFIKVPSTTQRRFRSLKLISKFKASEFRTLFHFRIPIIIRCMSKQVQKMLLSFLTAINLASSEYITYEIIDLVKELLYCFVEQYQNIFAFQHMTSNIHSLLHVSESLKYIDPLWMYSTFSYEDSYITSTLLSF